MSFDQSDFGLMVRSNNFRPNGLVLSRPNGVQSEVCAKTIFIPDHNIRFVSPIRSNVILCRIVLPFWLRNFFDQTNLYDQNSNLARRHFRPNGIFGHSTFSTKWHFLPNDQFSRTTISVMCAPVLSNGLFSQMAYLANQTTLGRLTSIQTVILLRGVQNKTRFNTKFLFAIEHCTS